MSRISLRHALPSDQAFLEEMLFASLYVPVGKEPFPRAILKNPDIAKYVEDWGKPDDIGFIAVDSEAAVAAGAAWLRLLTGAQKGYGYVSDDVPEIGIALRSAYRGRGIATLLLERLFESAALTYSGVSLSVSKANPALELYERLGFSTVSEDQNAFVMVKRFPHG